jgi:SPP1 family predicted phage head-tail adaptor
MRAGELKDRVSIQTRTETSDGHDGIVETWASSREDLKRRPAAVEQLTGRDLYSAQQIDPRLSHRVRLRYWGSYLTDLVGGRARLVYHDRGTDRLFEIVGSPQETVRRRELTSMCRELA